MNQEKKKEECDAPHAASSPEQVPEKGNEAETVPGQQIGLYGKADKKDVRRMVKILNPDKDSMESRG